MSSLKISRNSLFVFFLIFSNFWIFKIFKLNFLIGIIIVITTLAIILTQKSTKALPVTLICIFILLIIQIKTTTEQSLILLDNDEQRVQSERIKSYPPTYIDLYFRVIWMKPADWIERNNFIIALSRVERNLFENLSINKYFFGGFPQNRPEDFEKFTFFLLPFFIVGVYNLILKTSKGVLILVFIIPLGSMAVFGNKNSFGPFSLFPFFVLAFFSGIIYLAKKSRKKLFYIGLIFLILVGLVMQFSYAKI